MSIADLRTSAHILTVLGLVNVAFATKCFVMSIIYVDIAGLIGSLFVVTLGAGLIVTGLRRSSVLQVRILLGVVTVFFTLTIVSLVCGFFYFNLNFGFTENTPGMKVTGIITYGLEMFAIHQHVLLLSQFA